MTPRKPYEPIDPNPLAHLMNSERFTPPDRQDCREMTVTDPKTGEEVLMLRRGLGEMAVWKPASQWKEEDKAGWVEFYKKHPSPPPPPVYGTYQGDWDGNGDYPPGSGAYAPLIEVAQGEKPGLFEGWSVTSTDEKKSFLQVVLETIFVFVVFAALLLTLYMAISGSIK